MLVNTSTHEVSELKRQKESELGKMRTLAKLAITSVSHWLLFCFYPVFSFHFRTESVRLIHSFDILHAIYTSKYMAH